LANSCSYTEGGDLQRRDTAVGVEEEEEASNPD